MARTTYVILTDDITGEQSDDVEAFSVKLPNFVTDEDGTTELVVERWSFDAVSKSQQEFVSAIQKAVAKYRRNENVSVKVVGTGDGTSENTLAADQRAFAKSKGMDVSERGRISAKVKEAYDAAIADGSWTRKNTDDESDSTDSDTTDTATEE